MENIPTPELNIEAEQKAMVAMILNLCLDNQVRLNTILSYLATKNPDDKELIQTINSNIQIEVYSEFNQKIQSQQYSTYWNTLFNTAFAQ